MTTNASTRIIDLASRNWQLQGWRPYYWQLRKSQETGDIFAPEFGPYPAAVPGSVHAALHRAGVVPDWNQGRNSLLCEWIEHRQWEFFTHFSAGELPEGTAVVLQADGLDYGGWVLVDGVIAAEFRGALRRHQFDLTRWLGDGKAHQLSLLFDLPPEEQGQIGRTSLSRYFKPRYNFSWDWCVRLVPTGIWDRLALVCNPPAVEVVSVATNLADDLATGEVSARLRNDSGSVVRVSVSLRTDAGETVEEQTFPVEPGEQTVRCPVAQPRLWWPNGSGEPSLYEVTIREVSADSVLFQSTVGFRGVRWLPCEDAPEGARPLLCEVNGKTVFLQGINWTPATLDYPADTESDLRRLIDLYREMGCNVLRVWGGGFIEREVFYRLCDEAGLLIWQEFPLSSSGVDNEAPRDPAVIAELEIIATDYVRRRGHHACLLLWCGGNELHVRAETPDGHGRPLDESHPALAMLERVVAREAPGVRFLPTSPSGPVFYARREDMGQGIHHHVHGPWDRLSTEAEWLDYWQHDDSLLRAETGVSGTASVELLKHYVGGEEVWPPSNENLWWRHSGAWWVQWELLREKVDRLPAADQLKRFVELSQERQAQFLALAAAACKRRFPKCAGFIVWMGHDAFPCPANTSIIDFDRTPKPAYHALRRVFQSNPSEIPDLK